MSYLEMDKWSSDHESCKGEERFIVELLNTRSYEQRTSKKYDLLSAKIRGHLKQFETSVQALEYTLENEFFLTVAERERRNRLVEALQSSIIQLTQKFNSRSGEEDRNSLMAASGSSVLRDMGTTGWASEDEDEDPQTPLLMETSDQIRIQQSRLLEEQDQGLERLSKVIGRQKDIAVTIGSEVDLQNQLIGNISDRMERTNASIQNETTHIQVVTRKENTCGYWMVILSLLLAIIVVVLI